MTYLLTCIGCVAWGILVGWLITSMAGSDSEAKAWDSGFRHGVEHGKQLARNAHIRATWEAEELERIARL